MTTTKSIIDIITVQNSCKNIIQELYTYGSRPNDDIRINYKSAKVDDAIRLGIIEYDNFDNELSLSSDTEDYYKTRLGEQDETNISFIEDKLKRLQTLLQDYNTRIKNGENTNRDIKQIYKLLNQIPSLLRYNLQAISSTSVFKFQNEPNFDIKIRNLYTCKEEIGQLIRASNRVDLFIKEQKIFFKSIDNTKIDSATLKLERNSLILESSFRKIHKDIKN